MAANDFANAYVDVPHVATTGRNGVEGCEVSFSRKTTLACWLLLKAVLDYSSDLWSFSSSSGIGRETVVSFRLQWLGRCPNGNNSLHLAKGFGLLVIIFGVHYDGRISFACVKKLDLLVGLEYNPGGSPWALSPGYSFAFFSLLLRKPSKIWWETSKIKYFRNWCVGIRKTNWNRGMLFCYSVSVQKMITRSKTSTTQSSSAMNRSGSLRTYSHFSLVRTIPGKEKILYHRELLVSEKFFKTRWIPFVLPSPVILGEKIFLLSRITG